MVIIKVEFLLLNPTLMNDIKHKKKNIWPLMARKIYDRCYPHMWTHYNWKNKYPREESNDEEEIKLIMEDYYEEKREQDIFMWEIIDWFLIVPEEIRIFNIENFLNTGRNWFKNYNNERFDIYKNGWEIYDQKGNKHKILIISKMASNNGYQLTREGEEKPIGHHDQMEWCLELALEYEVEDSKYPPIMIAFDDQEKLIICKGILTKERNEDLTRGTDAIDVDKNKPQTPLTFDESSWINWESNYPYE